jgi:predicted DNA-binding transcriptional regulator AlpA
MTVQSSLANNATDKKPSGPTIVLLTPKEAAKLLRLSVSWLAKARMRGDGPPYIKPGERVIRYTEAALIQWMKSRQRLSTSER